VIVAVDIGGTCTDCVVIDAAGQTALGKAFSTPPDFFEGIRQAVGVAAAQLGTTAPDLLTRTRLFLHSTTVAENAIVDGDLAPVGLLTTRGFEDTLFATRGGYGRWSGLTEDEKRNPIDTDKPRPLVPRARVRGLRERTDARGAVLTAVDEAEVDAALQALVRDGAQAIGVCLLWSFVDPKNEQAVVARVRALRPDLFVTASHEIAPMLGEYERTSTVALNAGLGRVVARYLERLSTWLAEQRFRGTLLVMQAHGGLAPVAEAAARPVGLLESGPVGGLLGCQRLGERLGERDVIAADLGGTTFKIGTVHDGRIEYQRESMVLRYHYALPKLDVVSLGLAGGSVIAVDPRTGQPRLGPRSAGSYPGPICYDHGGVEPTLTDVDALLGYLDARFFLGGAAGLDVARARDGFARLVAEPLAMDVDAAAAAIHGLANSRIHDLVHRVTVQRGLDPRRFALFSTGGTAGMHLPAVGQMLGVRAVVVPHSASVHGAFGLATCDVVHEEVRTQPVRVPPDPGALDAVFDALAARVARQMEREGFRADQITLARAADMRYRRQVHIITVPIDEVSSAGGAPRFTAARLGEVTGRFETLYRQRYGPESTFRAAGIEMVTFRVRGTGVVPRPALRATPPGGPDPSAARVERRRAYVADAGWRDDVPAYDFTRLAPGHLIPGPAIVWTPITTVVVQSRQTATVDQYRNLILRPATAPSGHAGGGNAA
jgi:N-methylhydantoinase A